MSRPRVLIVDDEQHIVSLLSMTMRKNGYEVLTANNGHRALELIAAFKVDLMVVDQTMPGMTGVELADHVGDTMPVLMVTARPTMTRDEHEHIDDVIHKPFSPMELVSRVSALIGPGQAGKEQSA